MSVPRAGIRANESACLLRYGTEIWGFNGKPASDKTRYRPDNKAASTDVPVQSLMRSRLRWCIVYAFYFEGGTCATDHATVALTRLAHLCACYSTVVRQS